MNKRKLYKFDQKKIKKCIPKDKLIQRNGITLIALVITIIVMLILAGVSLNATIGDDGILTRARNTTYMQSVSVLSEYLNTVYITNSMDDIISSNDDGSQKSEIEKIIEQYPDWFFHDGSKDYILKNCTYLDDMGTTQNEFIKIRIIKKNNLPESIRKQLAGGEAIDGEGNTDSIEAYDKLMDVYCCTADMQVFYCSNGLESAIGANYMLSDKYDGTKIIYEAGSNVAQAVAKTSEENPEDLNMQNLRTVTELKIDESTGINNLSIIVDLPNLTKLTLTNYKGSLSGIERAYKLTYIYFENTDNTQNIDYNGLRKVKSLKELYFYNPNDSEVQKLCTEMSNTDYTLLKTFGLYGYMHSYYSTQSMWRNTMTSDYHTQLTSLSPLNMLTSATKQSIVCLYVQNNSLTSLSGIEDFTNVTKLLAMKNYLTDISAISTMSKLTSLYLNYNSLENDTLSNLEDHSNLKEMMLQGNTNITSLESISKTNGNPGTALTYFNGSDLSNLDFSTSYWNDTTKKTIFTISTVLLPTKYSMTYINVSYLRPDTGLTDSQLALLKNNTTITSLNLSSCKQISNAKMLEVLPTLTKLKELNVSNTNLSSLSWINNLKDKTVLRGINIQSTAITDITPLAGCTKLGCLVINGDKIKLYDSTNATYNTTITNIINSVSEHSYGSWANTCLGYGGFIPNSSTLQGQMKNLTGVKKWSFNALGGVNIDLRGWSQLTYLGGFCDSGKIYLPDTIKSFGNDSNATYYLDNPKNEFSISVSFCRQCPVITNNTKNYTLNVSSATASPNYYRSLFTPYLTSLTINAGGEYKVVNASGIDYREATNLNSLTLTSYTMNTLDFSLLPSAKLNNLKITSCKVRKLATTEPINIENVDLSNNSISSVETFMDSNIKVLNLKNNRLSNYISYKNADGKVITKTTSEFIVINIHGLEKIYLEGNEDLTNFSALINAGFKNDGKNNFTKQ